MGFDILNEKWKPGSDLLSRLFSILYFLVILGMLALIGISIYASLCGKSNPSVTDSNAVFAVILAGITIVLTTALVIPKIVIRGEVASEIGKLKQDIIDHIKENEIQLFNTPVNVTDAHLSRMMGFLLLDKASRRENVEKDQKEYLYELIWAIGWASRSYKNYIRGAKGTVVMGERVSLTNYSDLLNLNISTLKFAKEELFHRLIDPDDSNKMISTLEIVKRLFAEAGADEQEKYLGLFYRTIKEAVDIDYEFRLWQRTKNKKDFVLDKAAYGEQLKKWIKLSNPVAALLIVVICSHKAQRGNLSSADEGKDEIMSEILRRSSNGHKPNFAARLKGGIGDITNNFSDAVLDVDKISKFVGLMRKR